MRYAVWGRAARGVVIAAALGAASVVAAASAAAQVVETPVAFDSAGRVRAITPTLAARLALAPPPWPVQGDYVEARLYRQGAGTFVLVVQRRAGEYERFAMTGEERETLRAAVSSGMSRGGRLTSEERADVISEPARGAFLRNQLLLALGVYGPSVAALANDAEAGVSLYLLTAGGTFFVVSALSRHTPITRAQNHLSTDGAVRGALIGVGLAHAASGGLSEDAAAGAILAGGVTGAVSGVLAGRGLTDGESHAATWGSSALALTTLGAMGSAGLLDGRSSDRRGRAVIGGLAVAGLAGYPLGLGYSRHARYAVTAGDVGAVRLAGLLGAMAALTPAVRDNGSERTGYAAGTAGFLGGMVLGDRWLARRYDLTEGEARLLSVGMVSGALVAEAILAADEPDDPRVAMGALTAGAVGGLAVTVHMIHPRRAERVGALPGRGTVVGGALAAPSAEARGRALTLLPLGAAMAGAGIPGRYPILHARF